MSSTAPPAGAALPAGLGGPHDGLAISGKELGTGCSVALEMASDIGDIGLEGLAGTGISTGDVGSGGDVGSSGGVVRISVTEDTEDGNGDGNGDGADAIRGDDDDDDLES